MSSKKQITVGGLRIGGGAEISVQTMTNTNTEDIDSTLEQVHRAFNAGCDLIRISCPTQASTNALKKIVENSPIPIIADIHFNYKRAIEAIDAGVACIRINPGNISDDAITEIVTVAKRNHVAIRIGINSGSVEKDILDKYGEPSVAAIVESAILNCRRLERLDFTNFKISVKSSNVKSSIEAYRKLSQAVDYPLHLGITEAGTLFPGTIKSAIGIGSLLADGIGDTIRVSLSADIEEEVRVGRQILRSLGLLKNSVNVISCPTCARTLIDVIGISNEIENFCNFLNKSIKISILGCVVNGIGEAQQSDIGVFGFKKGIAKLYLHGKEIETLNEEDIIPRIKSIVESWDHT